MSAEPTRSYVKEFTEGEGAPALTVHPEYRLQEAIENLEKGLTPTGNSPECDKDLNPTERFSFESLWEQEGDQRATLHYKKEIRNGAGWTPYMYAMFFDKPLSENKIKTLLINHGFPYSIASQVFGEVDLETAPMKHYREYTMSPTSILTVAGDCGCGKTFGATWAVSELLKSKKVKTVGFLKSSDADGYLRGNNRDFDKPKVPDKGVDILVIDDLCSEVVTSVIKAQVTNLIDFRIEKGLKTLVTTNLIAREIEELYGERLMSRLARGTANFAELHPEPEGKGLNLEFENVNAELN